MNKSINLVLIVISVILLSITLSISRKRYYNDLDNNICFYQFNSNFSNLSISEEITSPFSEIMSEYNFGKALHFSRANFLVFDDYTWIDQKLQSVPLQSWKIYYINGMRGLDQLCSKSQLALHLRRYNFTDIIPVTYCLSDKSDMEEFLQNKSGPYILKKNIQRQDGLKITRDYDWIVRAALGEEYVVAQKLLTNPYIIADRKINIRVYMIVIRQPNSTKCDFYIYNNGFIYYTKKPYDENSDSLETNITTGYIDREVYENNPLTTQDFFRHLGVAKATLLLTNIYQLFQKIQHTYRGILSNANREIPGFLFNIFGVDIAPNKELGVAIMECNKGCSLVYMDKRDKEVKYNMIRDLMTLIGVVHNGKSKNFIEII